VVTQCGFASDPFVSKDEKVLYNTKIATARLSSIPGKHRIVQSIDPLKQTAKYLITDQLTFEASKILSMYSHRWVIEEFFRNAKQLSSMEGATIRSEQGVTLALCLVSWIDFLLHYENYKHCTAGELPQESLKISIARSGEAGAVRYELLKLRARGVIVKVKDKSFYRVTQNGWKWLWLEITSCSYFKNPIISKNFKKEAAQLAEQPSKIEEAYDLIDQGLAQIISELGLVG
jgi:hypothetical protein